MSSGGLGVSSLIVLGAGGHGRVIADVFSRVAPSGHVIFFDDRLQGQEVNGHRVQGRLSEWQDAAIHLSRTVSTSVGVIIGIGDNLLRRDVALKVHVRLAKMGGYVQFVTLSDPSAVVSSTAFVGHGTLLVPQSVVNANAMIGAHVIINTAASVGHDCEVADHAHIAPGARLAGGVRVGEGTHIGVGASIIPGVRIGAWSVIGAGSVVVTDIPDGVIAYGVPAKPVRENPRVPGTFT